MKTVNVCARMEYNFEAFSFGKVASSPISETFQDSVKPDIRSVVVYPFMGEKPNPCVNPSVRKDILIYF